MLCPIGRITMKRDIAELTNLVVRSKGAEKRYWKQKLNAAKRRKKLYVKRKLKEARRQNGFR